MFLPGILDWLVCEINIYLIYSFTTSRGINHILRSHGPLGDVLNTSRLLTMNKTGLPVHVLIDRWCRMVILGRVQKKGVSKRIDRYKSLYLIVRYWSGQLWKLTMAEYKRAIIDYDPNRVFALFFLLKSTFNYTINKGVRIWLVINYY
jgi:hypothetical protein